MTIGEMLKKARLDAGLTQKQLAEKCEMADSAIRKYESGRIVPKIKTITKIASALGMSTSDFISGGSYAEKSISEREFYATQEMVSRIRHCIKQERYTNPSKEITSQLINSWISEFAPAVAEKYAISVKSLDSETIEWLVTDIHLVTEIDQLPEHHRQVVDLMDTLNETGQRVAVARIEELTQIPAYQRHAAPAGDSTQSAGAGDEKDPE